MRAALVELLSRWSIERRGVILVVSAIIAIGFGAALPLLKVDSSPDALASTVEGQAEVSAEFRRHFPGSDSQLLIILRAADVTQLQEIRYQNTLSRALKKAPGITRVDSLTEIALSPDRGAPTSSLSERSLPLNNPPADNAKAPGSAVKKRPSPSKEALQALVEGDPSAFPDGISSLGAVLQSGSLAAPPRLKPEISPPEHRAFLRALGKTPWITPLLLSEDRTAAALVVHFDDARVHDQSSRMAALAEVRALLAEHPAPKGMQITLGGVPVLAEAILTKLERDQFTLNPAMMIVCLLVLWLSFRWWPAVVAPMCAVGLAALAVIGGMALLGQPLTILTNIIPPLLIIVGLSDSVHLLGRYEEELSLDSDRIRAGRRAARAMLVACFLTSLTTAVGFGSLASARTPELGRFGIAAAVGVIFAYFATVLFVPAFVTKMSPPRRTQEGSGSVRLLDRWIFVLTRNVLRHAKLVGILSLLAAIVLAWSATRVTADARLLDAFDKDEPASTTTRLLEDKLAGIRPLEVMISPNEGSVLSPEVLQRVEEVEHWASTQDGVITVVSYAQPLRAARLAVTDQEESMTRPFASLAHTRALGELLASGEKDPLTAWMSPDEKVARMTVFFRDTGIRRTLRVIESLKEEFEQGSGALRVSFVGEAYTGSVGRDSVLRDLISGLTLALVSIFVLLALLFRSLRLGLVAMPPNIIPLLATGAYMMARGIHLNMATVITFSIGIGLAVDDTVHVVARFLEERRRISSVRVALLRAARGTGRAIVITAISLSLGFSVLMLSEFVSVRQFGELIAVTVLNCLVSALFIQPALLLLVTKSKG